MRYPPWVTVQPSGAGQDLMKGEAQQWDRCLQGGACGLCFTRRTRPVVPTGKRGRLRKVPGEPLSGSAWRKVLGPSRRQR